MDTYKINKKYVDNYIKIKFKLINRGKHYNKNRN